MKRLKLLFLQIVVMVVALLIWHVVSTTSLFGDVKTTQFFFSTPLAVLERTFKQLTSTEIYWHLGITLTETVLAFVIGSAAGMVMMVQLVTSSLLLCAHRPAKLKGCVPVRWMNHGSRPPSD